MSLPEGARAVVVTASNRASAGVYEDRSGQVLAEGLRELGFAMAAVVRQARADRPAAPPTRIVLRPLGATGAEDFEVVPTDEGWRVRGEKPERWVRQTDFTNDEAVGFLADR